MGIVDGYIKTKRYRKQADNNYILQSELTMSGSVEFDDGTTLPDKIISIEGKIETHDHKEQTLKPSCLEMTPPSGFGHGGYVDFHYDGETEADFTSRIAELQAGILTVTRQTELNNVANCEANQLRNIVLTTTDPGANQTTSYANGSIIFVYE